MHIHVQLYTHTEPHTHETGKYEKLLHTQEHLNIEKGKC